MTVTIDRTHDCLLIVDAQPTFMPGGGLGVPNDQGVLDAICAVASRFTWIVATQDLHPRGHISLASSYAGTLGFRTIRTKDLYGHGATIGIGPDALFSDHDLEAYLELVGEQTLWPDHAVNGTTEAALHPRIAALPLERVIVKGMDPRCDSYSGFKDNLGRPTGLADVLRELRVRRVFCGGYVRKYCVGFTAIDGTDMGFETYLFEDGTADLPGPNDDIDARLRAAGVSSVHMKDIV